MDIAEAYTIEQIEADLHDLKPEHVYDYAHALARRLDKVQNRTRFLETTQRIQGITILLLAGSICYIAIKKRLEIAE